MGSAALESPAIHLTPSLEVFTATADASPSDATSSDAMCHKISSTRKQGCIESGECIGRPFGGASKIEGSRFMPCQRLVAVVVRFVRAARKLKARFTREAQTDGKNLARRITGVFMCRSRLQQCMALVSQRSARLTTITSSRPVCTGWQD